MNSRILILALMGIFSLAKLCSVSDAQAPTQINEPAQGEPMDKLAAMRTPIFWAEGHPGKLNRENWSISVTGLCVKPQTFTWQKLLQLPQSEVQGRLTSVTRWSVGGLWKGIALSTLLKEVGMKPSCRYVRFWSVGEIYDTSIPLDIALQEKSIMAHSYEGQYLSEDYGGPVRAFIPYLWGYKSAKSVVKIELLDRYIPGFWESRGYTDSADIEAGSCRDINDGGKIKQIPAGEVLEFTK